MYDNMLSERSISILPYKGRSPKGGCLLLYPGGHKKYRGYIKMSGAYSRKPGGKTPRADRAAGNRSLFEANKKIILATQSVCAICGKPVDKSIKYPDPMSPTVDHTIPIAKNGDPVSLDNLQLAHRYCNRMKSDKLMNTAAPVDENRKLPLTENWATY